MTETTTGAPPASFSSEDLTRAAELLLLGAAHNRPVVLLTGSHCAALFAEFDRLRAEIDRLRQIVTGAGCTCGLHDYNHHETYCPCRPAGSAGVS